MTFGLIGWLKSQYHDLDYEVPVWYPSKDQADSREWLITNGLGGYSMSTVSSAHRRRYHGILVTAIDPPRERHVVLSKIEELVTIDGVEHDLATNHWESGVVSPTGYKKIESFTTLPVPTWVYELGGHYLVKQLNLSYATNQVTLGYTFIPRPQSRSHATIRCRFLVGFRSFHSEVTGSSDDRYPQFISPSQSVIILNESAHRLCLAWTSGAYSAEKQWWWDFHWAEEAARGLPDREDLYLVGSVTSELEDSKEFSIGASFEKPIDRPSLKATVIETLNRQKKLIALGKLPKGQKTDMLLLACDRFLVAPSWSNQDALKSDGKGNSDTETPAVYVIEGYPWFNDSGRAAMISLPGLTLATKRHGLAKKILETYSHQMQDGLIPNRMLDKIQGGPKTEYTAADITLWFAWSLYLYHRATKDLDTVRRLLPKLKEAAKHYINGTNVGIKIDAIDGLLVCSSLTNEFSWMDTKVADIPITPRSGKAVDLNALWYNFLETLLYLSAVAGEETDAELEKLKEMSALAKKSMQNFWNAERNCLFDVIDRTSNPRIDESVRPNQLLAVSMPFRAFDPQQTKSILIAVESELLTPMGLRTLSASDSSYQGTFGCGFSHADQYHRDLSYHQGTAWPWLLGAYCDALVNVFGIIPETSTRVSLILQPLFGHMVDEACLGGVSEIFDGNRPHLARGSVAHALATAELMRWHNWQLRN